MKTCGTCVGYEHGSYPCINYNRAKGKDDDRAETCPLYMEFKDSWWKTIVGLKIGNKSYNYGYKCMNCTQISLERKLVCPYCYANMTNGEEE